MTSQEWITEPRHPPQRGDYLVTLEQKDGRRITAIAHWSGQWYFMDKDNGYSTFSSWSGRFEQKEWEVTFIAWKPIAEPYTVGEEIAEPQCCKECGLELQEETKSTCGSGSRGSKGSTRGLRSTGKGRHKGGTPGNRARSAAKRAGNK